VDKVYDLVECLAEAVEKILSYKRNHVAKGKVLVKCLSEAVERKNIFLQMNSCG